jgi:hypothetical protein
MLELRLAAGDRFEAETGALTLGRDPAEGRLAEGRVAAGRVAGSAATPPPAACRDSILARAASRLAAEPTD